MWGKSEKALLQSVFDVNILYNYNTVFQRTSDEVSCRADLDT